MSRLPSKEDLKCLFDKFDVDVNGSLNTKELNKLMIYCGYNPTEDFVKLMDKNDDDCVDFHEFYDFIKKQPDPVGELREAFYLHDKNGDGYIDREEMKGILTRGVCTTDEEIDDLFKLCDTDNDGKIQYEEFVKIFTEPCEI